MVTSTAPVSSLAGFDISSFLSERPGVRQGRQITLAPGKTTKFKTVSGEDAEIVVRSLKLNLARSVDIPAEVEKGKVRNFAADIYADVDVKLNGELLPYFNIYDEVNDVHMKDLPKHIYVQNFQCTGDTMNELIKFLKSTHDWRVRPNVKPSEQALATNADARGHRFIASPPPPPSNAEGEADFSNYGTPISELVIGSTYSAIDYQDGFRDFATELTETFEAILATDQIEDPTAKAEAKADMSRYLLSLTGGRDDGWARTAQINQIKIGNKSFDLWSAQDEEFDINKLGTVPVQVGEEGRNASATLPTGTTDEEPF